MESKFLDVDAQTACVYRKEEKEMMLVAMIAQGRVPENPYAIELAQITDWQYTWQVSLGKSLPGCYCSACTLPAGSENVHTFLTCKQVKEMPADMGQADVGTMAMATTALNLLSQVGEPKSPPLTL